MSAADVVIRFSALKLIKNSVRNALKKNLTHAMMIAIEGKDLKRTLMVPWSPLVSSISTE